MTSTGPPTSSSSAATATTTDGLTGDSLPLIDLRLLSHSELLSLSLSTARNKVNGPIADDDDDNLVNPRIDRSVFNESAGSRRQTFSRLRLAPRQATTAAASAHPPPPQLVPIEEEDPRVISLLRQLFHGEGCPSEKIEEDSKLVRVPIEYDGDAAGIGMGTTSVAVEVVEDRRKRGRPKKTAGNDSYNNQEGSALGTHTTDFERPEFLNPDR